jgi:DNA (cytosine-5)-methyltransferase 1
MSGIKPPYKVQSMKEIEQIPWNGYNVVSTFSGGGGSCLGYRMAGFHVIWASEFVEEAQKTYRANHKGTILDTRDIREVKPEDILTAIHMKPGEIDLFDGSPPCCAFSTAGKREKGWGQKREYSDGKSQQIENLFFEYIRLLNGLQPKTFVAENVSGLVKGTALGYFKEFLREMKKCGYRVKAQLLNAKYLGVPQSRERLIFIGVREDLNADPIYPKPKSYIYSLKDAFTNLEIDEEERKMLLDSAKKYAWGRIAEKMPKNPYRSISGQEITGHGYFNLTRQPLGQPSGTLCQSHGGLSVCGSIHPLENRKYTIGELKRITSIPDDFILTGNYSQQYERLARMVPPVMMMNIAKTIQTEILDKQPRTCEKTAV